MAIAQVAREATIQIRREKERRQAQSCCYKRAPTDAIRHKSAAAKAYTRASREPFQTVSMSVLAPPAPSLLHRRAHKNTSATVSHCVFVCLPVSVAFSLSRRAPLVLPRQDCTLGNSCSPAAQWPPPLACSRNIAWQRAESCAQHVIRMRKRVLSPSPFAPTLLSVHLAPSLSTSRDGGAPRCLPAFDGGGGSVGGVGGVNDNDEIFSQQQQPHDAKC